MLMKSIDKEIEILIDNEFTKFTSSVFIKLLGLQSSIKKI